MNATVNVVLFKSKTLANGEHPLMIRVCKDNKKKYKSLGISIHPQFWDFDKNKPRKNCPNKEQIQTLISDNIKDLSGSILDFKTENKEFTATKVIERVKEPSLKKTVEQLFDSEINRLQGEGRLKYASTYKELKASLLNFNMHLDIYFSEIDINWLKRYEAYLRTKGLADNSIGVRFRTLRTLFNKAISENIVKSDYYPFKAYKVSKLRKGTVKRAITKADIELIINHKVESDYSQLAIDLFYFSYLSGGINFVDMAYLKADNIIDKRLIYNRKKTKKLIKLPMQEKALHIIDKYKSDNCYLFPVLSDFHKTEVQKANRIHKVLAKVNKCLKEIGTELNLHIDITTYMGRHSYFYFHLKMSEL